MTVNIINAIAALNEQPDRLPISIMLPLAEKIHTYIKSIEKVSKSSIAGSVRRMNETIKDIDFIIATEDPKIVTESLLLLNNITEYIVIGKKKIYEILK